MPAVSILKKPFARRRSPPPPPPPTAPPVAEPKKPSIPPKPKRGVVPLRPVEGVRFVDDDEPTTEESYDFKDIDFASEIFDFRVPPPRPRRPRSPPPPPLLQNGSAVRLAGEKSVLTKADRSAIAVVTGGAADDAPAIAAEADQSAVAVKTDVVPKEAPATATEADRSAVVAQTDGAAVEPPATEEPAEDEEEDDDDELDEIKTDDLARFLAEHEGKELTLEDVRQLELLLDEVERKENGHDGELQKEVDADVEEEATSERVPAVRFGVAEIIEDGGGVVLEEDLQGAAEVQDDHKTDADYSDVRFHSDAMKRKKKKKAAEFGIYEPVGQPDLRRLRPDLSSYVAPMPSSNVGDPFSWRRRGKRRHDDYGYADQRRGRKAPAMDKILDGCAEVERLIVSRDLSPPGGLLDFLESSSLDRKYRKKKKQKTTAECSSPAPPPSEVLQNGGPGSPLPELPEEAADEEVDQLQEVDEVVPLEPEPEMDSERMAELENQILTGATYVESLITPIDVKQEMVVGSTAAVEDVLETPIVKMTAYETTADTFEMIDADIEDMVVPLVVEKAELSYEPGPIVPKRLSRRDGRLQRFSSPPVRPERRKRVASADPLLQSVPASDVWDRIDLATAPPPRSKARRSASFHTAEEIRRKIDTQAQLFLRTPRRRDRTSPTYESTCPSASATLTYGRTLCRPRPPLTPVYSHVNKDAIARKKEAAAQTVDSSGSDVERLPPLPPRDGACSAEPYPEDMNGDEQAKPEDIAVAESEVGVSPEPPTGVTSEPEVSVEPQVIVDGQPTAAQEMEDSEVPTEFHSLVQTTPADATAVEDSETSPSPADDPMALADSKDLSVQSRPLPPPPAPPRHRGPKNVQSISGLSPDTPVVFCGIVPQKGEALTSKLTVVPEMKVLRLSVVQLDASLIRVAQIEADHVITHRLDELHGSHGSASTPSPQPPPGSGGSQRPPPDCDSRQQQSPSVESPDCPDHETNQNVHSDEPPNDGLDINSNWEPWEPGYCDGRAGCDSPLTGAASTTSGSASYVTCDETLHDDEDDAELTNAFDQCSVDGGFGFDEDATDGCPTPTELAMDDVIEPRPPELWDGPVPSAAFSSTLSSLSSLSTFPSDTTPTAVTFSAFPVPWRSTAAAADENCNLPAHVKPESVSRSEPSTDEPCSVPTEVDLAPAVALETPAAVGDGLSVAVGHELLEPPLLTDSEGQSETG